MTEKAEAIITAAIALPESERSSVVDAILNSMDSLSLPTDDRESAWQRTLDIASRRAEELRSGRVQGMSASKVHADLERQVGMAARQVVYHPEAAQELRASYDWYRERSPRAAQLSWKPSSWLKRPLRRLPSLATREKWSSQVRSSAFSFPDSL